MKHILLFRHEQLLRADHLTDYLDGREIPYRWIDIHSGDAIPESLERDVAGLVFLGGSISVNDPLPWIADELNLIRKAQEVDFPMLGHCLGAQLISKALGGEVHPLPVKEIGWHPIRPLDNPSANALFSALPDEISAMQWHDDEYSLPSGATPLYVTEHCENQAFVLGDTLATQAHLELTGKMLNQWLDYYGYDIERVAPSIQPIRKIRQQIPHQMKRMHMLSDSLYAIFLAAAYPEIVEQDGTEGVVERIAESE